MAARVLNGRSREAECSRPDNTGGAASRTRPLTDLDQEAVRLGLLDLFAVIIDGRKIGVRAAPRLPAEGNDDSVGDGYADVQRLAVRGDLVGTAEEAVDAGYAEFALPAVDEVVGLQVDGVDEVVAGLAEELVPAQAALDAVAAVAPVDVVGSCVAEEPLPVPLAEDVAAAGDVVFIVGARRYGCRRRCPVCRPRATPRSSPLAPAPQPSVSCA